MAKIIKYSEEEDVLTLRCECNNCFESDCSEYTSKFNEEFGEYDNYYTTCPSCERIHVLVMNIPIGEYDEIYFEISVMPFEEINARKYLRDFIWAKREDLQNQNRARYNEKSKTILNNVNF